MHKAECPQCKTTRLKFSVPPVSLTGVGLPGQGRPWGKRAQNILSLWSLRKTALLLMPPCLSFHLQGNTQSSSCEIRRFPSKVTPSAHMFSIDVPRQSRIAQTSCLAVYFAQFLPAFPQWWDCSPALLFYSNRNVTVEIDYSQFHWLRWSVLEEPRRGISNIQKGSSKS